MSEHSAIEWTHHTFNPWSGCAKVSPGCANCYAAALPPSMRRGAEWGASAARVPASEDYWRQPLRWNRAAEKAGERRRVFCASVADVFEDRADLDPWRERLWSLIAATPHLDWLLLTKRPENMLAWSREHSWPDNAWAGASVENQEAADQRIPILCQVPARVRFLSMEPLLGPVDLNPLWCWACGTGEHVRFEPPAQPWCIECDTEVGGSGWLDSCSDVGQPGISWVIVGGESGRRARPMHPEWARSIRDQCVAADVPFFFKQWGEWVPRGGYDVGITHYNETDPRVRLTICGCNSSSDLDAYGIPGVFSRGHECSLGDDVWLQRIGKKAAGRLLDGRTWDEVPDAR